MHAGREAQLSPSAESKRMGGVSVSLFSRVEFVRVSEGEGVVRADFLIYYCEAVKESLCFFKEARVSIPVKVVKGSGNHMLTASYKLRISG